MVKEIGIGSWNPPRLGKWAKIRSSITLGSTKCSNGLQESDDDNSKITKLNSINFCMLYKIKDSVFQAHLF